MKLLQKELELPSEFPYTDGMKIKTFSIEIKNVKTRQPFAPLQRKINSKKIYSRKRFKLELH